MEVFAIMSGKLRKGSKVFVFCVCIVFAVFMFYFICASNKLTAKEKEKLGLQVVEDLYNFRDAYQLDQNMVNLKECVTSEVFNDLTIDNEQRTLTTYLKFKNSSTTVNVIKSTDTYVYYSLKNENIDETRKFVFFYDVDANGKICWYKEVESIEFINTIY